MEDMAICIDAIRKYWKNNEYYVITVSNGKSAGYNLTENVKKNSNLTIELDNNAGHLRGNAQLLEEGIKNIPSDCRYTIVLEADTWIFTDEIIDKYINILDNSESVWASAEWVEKKWSLGVDIAIMKTDFLLKNKEIFNFTIHPESHVCNYLIDRGFKYVYIRENMPVHVPKTMRHIYKTDGGRIREFPEAKMVTHHIEALEGGIEEKKYRANICLGEKVFDVGDIRKIKKENRKLKTKLFWAKIFPRSSWIKKKIKEKI